MSVRRRLGVVVVAALLAAASSRCSRTCPKEQIDEGAGFVMEMCSVERFGRGELELRPGAAWATVDKWGLPLSDGVPLFLYPDGAEVGGRFYPSPGDDALRDALAAELGKRKELAGRTSDPPVPHLLLAIAADTPIEVILPAIDLSRSAGFNTMTLVAATTTGPPIPPLPVPEVEGELAALAATLTDAERPREAALAQLREAETKRCPALHDAGSDPSVPAEERCLGHGRAILAACEACRCDVDIARNLSLGMIGYRPRMLFAECSVGVDPDVTHIVAEPGELWADLAPRVFAASGHAVRLHVGP